MSSNKTDAEKGQDIIGAFRHYGLVPRSVMTVPMLTSYYARHSLDLDDMESGLNYTRLQGWTENAEDQASMLTEEGHALVLD